MQETYCRLVGVKVEISAIKVCPSVAQQLVFNLVKAQKQGV